MTKTITDFQDDYGRITSWPSKRRQAHQQAILHYLRGLFKSGTSYTQEEALSLLKENSTIENPEVLLDALLESDYLSGSLGNYWRSDSRPSR